MGFDDRILRSIDLGRQRREELSPVMERAYTRATKILDNPDYAISEREFIDVYGEAQVESDRALVQRCEANFARRETEFERNSKKIASIFEAIMLQESELSEWFGKATTFKTSAFDDYQNGIDMIAEWERDAEGSRVLALAVDVTFGASTIEKKMSRIRESLERGELGTIKYFKDARGDFYGVRKNVPHAVIGLSQQSVQELAQLWVDGEKRQLGAHPAQREIAEQMYAQLDAMEQYARTIGQFASANSIRASRLVVGELVQEKRHLALGSLVVDPVAAQIRDQITRQFR